MHTAAHITDVLPIAVLTQVPIPFGSPPRAIAKVVLRSYERSESMAKEDPRRPSVSHGWLPPGYRGDAVFSVCRRTPNLNRQHRTVRRDGAYAKVIDRVNALDLTDVRRRK